MRAKKALKNTIWSLIYEGVALVCGLVLPRLILSSFGSQYNGVTSAITQFLAIISLMQAGIGGVTMAALYKPLAEGDSRRTSIILKSTEGFLRRIALLFVGFVFVIACTYPFLVIDEFDWLFTASLVMIMSISIFSQFYIGQTYEYLLAADQKQHIVHIVNAVRSIATTSLSVVMIRLGHGVHAVQTGTAIINILSTIFIYYYAKRKYAIDADVQRDNSTIGQRWDNFGQDVANFIVGKISLVSLSIFADVYAVSVFTVYNFVSLGIASTITAFTRSLNHAFGNMLVKNDPVVVKRNFQIYEQMVFILCTFIISVSFVMIIPFVTVYTKGITDTNYINYPFAYVFISASFVRCVRIPYVGVVNAAGHFRQMRNPAIVEASAAVALSVAMVPILGILGAALAILIASSYRTACYAMYLSKNIIFRSPWLYFKRLILSGASILLTIAVSAVIPLREDISFFAWVVNALAVSFVAAFLACMVEVLFYRTDLISFLRILRGTLGKRA